MKKNTKQNADSATYSNLNTYAQGKMTWGGETKRGYIHYTLPNGEKVSLPLGKK